VNAGNSGSIRALEVACISERTQCERRIKRV